MLMLKLYARVSLNTTKCSFFVVPVYCHSFSPLSILQFVLIIFLSSDCCVESILQHFQTRYYILKGIMFKEKRLAHQ